MVLLSICEGKIIKTPYNKFLSTRMLFTDDLRTDLYTNIPSVLGIFCVVMETMSKIKLPDNV